MTAEEIKKKDSEYIMHTYGRFDIVLDHGKGATLWDADGKEYVDLTSGIGVNSLGHGNEKIVGAITKQAEKLMHASNLYYTEPMVSAAEKLVTATGMGKIFFANSGAEANEGAIKVARKYSFDKYGTGRNKIVTLIQSFHGRTVTTLKATGQEKFHQYFFPFTEGFDYAKANDLADVTAKADKTCCAVMMEMIQGEGGVLPLDKEFVQGVAKFCKEHDILLIVDEVQTGIGRCGSLFAYEQYGISPDIVTILTCKKLFRHIMPVKLRADVKFGFSEPDETGVCYALLCLLYGKYEGKLILEPDFEHELLEGEIRCKGRIRLINLIYYGISFYRNKKLKEFITLIQNL